MVREKSGNMKNWPKVREFCDQPWNFTNFDPKLCQICIWFVPTKKFSSDLESPHFPMFSAKCRESKIGGKIGRGTSRSGQGKVREKYFVKSVGTLNSLEQANLQR